MPCEHCPHCRQIEEEQRIAMEKLLAEQEQIAVKQEISDDAPLTIDLSHVYEHLKPVALQIFHTWVEKKIHVIDGIAGGGKSFLLNVLWKLFKENRNVKYLSYSEIGSPTRTTIRKFIEELSYRYATETDIILIDNVNQIAKDDLMELSNKLKHIFNNKKTFGGVCVIMAVDFGMPLPYSQDRSDKTSKYWLTELGDEITRHYLSHSGNGRDVFVEELRTTQKTIIEDRNVVAHENLLIQFVYGELYGEEPYAGMEAKDGIILAPRQIYVDKMNNLCMEKLRGETVELEAQFDGNIIRGDLDMHTIVLKKHCIVALVTPYNGLPAGTRMIFLDEDRRTLFCRIIDGERAGTDIEIERVSRNLAAHSTESQQWVQQFPVELAFAMGIFRTQGRRFTKVGIANLDECFAHGMVYSALSRTESLFGIKVLAKNDMDKVIHTKQIKEMINY